MAQRVLVIDDEATIRAALCATLGDAGYAVAAARDGVEGVETLRSESADAVVMDIYMPVKDGFETIRLCVAYEIDGRRVETWPSSGSALSRATPIYEDFEGWEQPIHDVRSLTDLPESARRYVTALEEHASVPIVLVSVGPERTQTIERAWRSMRQRQVVPA